MNRTAVTSLTLSLYRLATFITVRFLADTVRWQ